MFEVVAKILSTSLTIYTMIYIIIVELSFIIFRSLLDDLIFLKSSSLCLVFSLVFVIFPFQVTIGSIGTRTYGSVFLFFHLQSTVLLYWIFVPNKQNRDGFTSYPF